MPKRARRPGASSISRLTGGIARQKVSGFTGRSRALVRARIIGDGEADGEPEGEGLADGGEGRRAGGPNGSRPDQRPRLATSSRSTRAEASAIRSQRGNVTGSSLTVTAAYRV